MFSMPSERCRERRVFARRTVVDRIHIRGSNHATVEVETYLQLHDTTLLPRLEPSTQDSRRRPNPESRSSHALLAGVRTSWRSPRSRPRPRPRRSGCRLRRQRWSRPGFHCGISCYDQSAMSGSSAGVLPAKAAPLHSLRRWAVRFVSSPA